jgi:hypothetical protein
MGRPSDEKMVLKLQFLLVLPAQSLSGLSIAGLVTIFHSLNSETPPTRRTRFLYLFPPGSEPPCYAPGHWVPFCRLLRLEELQ